MSSSSCRTSSSNRGSLMPLMYQGEPLSARIIPYRLQRLGDDPGVVRVARGVHRRLEADAEAHRRKGRRRRLAGVVARRVDVGVARPVRREPEGVLDRPGRHLVVPDEPGQDRQARRVRTGPASGSKRVRAEVPGGTAAGSPVVAEPPGIEQLEEATCVAIDHQDVPVAGRIRSAFDERVRRDRIADLVGLVVVVEGDSRAGCRRRDHLVRDAISSV